MAHSVYLKVGKGVWGEGGGVGRMFFVVVNWRRLQTEFDILQFDISKCPESMCQKVHFHGTSGESKIKTALFLRTYKVDLKKYTLFNKGLD